MILTTFENHRGPEYIIIVMAAARSWEIVKYTLPRELCRGTYH